MKYLEITLFLLLILLLTNCSTVESTGDAVDAAGRGTGKAISGVSQAVGDAGSAVGAGVETVVTGTGKAINNGAKKTNRKGY